MRTLSSMISIRGSAEAFSATSIGKSVSLTPTGVNAYWLISFG